MCRNIAARAQVVTLGWHCAGETCYPSDHFPLVAELDSHAGRVFAQFLVREGSNVLLRVHAWLAHHVGAGPGLPAAESVDMPRWLPVPAAPDAVCRVQGLAWRLCWGRDAPPGAEVLQGEQQWEAASGGAFPAGAVSCGHGYVARCRDELTILRPDEGQVQQWKK